MPIVMAMVAGVFLQFVLNLIFAVRDDATTAVPMTAAFLLLSGFPKVARVLPPVIGALMVGVVAIVFVGGFDLQGPVAMSFIRPNLYAPEFSSAAMVELVLPLTITVLACAKCARNRSTGGGRPQAAGQRHYCRLWTGFFDHGSFRNGFDLLYRTSQRDPRKRRAQRQALCGGGHDVVVGCLLRFVFADLHPIDVGIAEGICGYARGSSSAESPAASFHYFVQWKVHVWGFGVIPRGGGECADIFHRCGVLGHSDRLCSVLVPRTTGFRDTRAKTTLSFNHATKRSASDGSGK
jgi:Benzoate membrane transport protein